MIGIRKKEEIKEIGDIQAIIRDYPSIPRAFQQARGKGTTTILNEPTNKQQKKRICFSENNCRIFGEALFKKFYKKRVCPLT